MNRIPLASGGGADNSPLAIAAKVEQLQQLERRWRAELRGLGRRPQKRFGFDQRDEAERLSPWTERETAIAGVAELVAEFASGAIEQRQQERVRTSAMTSLARRFLTDRQRAQAAERRMRDAEVAAHRARAGGAA